MDSYNLHSLSDAEPSAEALVVVSELEHEIHLCDTWRQRAVALSVPWSSQERPGGINPDTCASAQTLLSNIYFEKWKKMRTLECDVILRGD